MQNGGRSFEEILSSVEEDEGLKNGASQVSVADPAANEQTVPVGAGLGTLFAHPELISKLPILLRAVQTLSEPTEKPTEKRPSTPAALLCALRPYLSESRQRTLDTMIKVSKLTEALRSMQ